MRMGVAALVSGGLDSAVMLAELSRHEEAVFPIYVRCGLFWEQSELTFLDKFVSAISQPAIQPVQELVFPMDDLYQGGWYSSSRTVPGYREADEEWEIPGRNIILLAKTAVWCKLHGVQRIAHGTLAGNPFPDATPEFFAGLEKIFSHGLRHPLKIVRPLGRLQKAEIIRKGRNLPLDLTLSCPMPVEESHCGQCGKCRERITAFSEADVSDPTPYYKIAI